MPLGVQAGVRGEGPYSSYLIPPSITGSTPVGPHVLKEPRLCDPQTGARTDLRGYRQGGCTQGVTDKVSYFKGVAFRRHRLCLSWARDVRLSQLSAVGSIRCNIRPRNIFSLAHPKMCGR